MGSTADDDRIHGDGGCDYLGANSSPSRLVVIATALARRDGQRLAMTLDKPIFAVGHIVSGHTLKHLAAAAAGYWILQMRQKRKPVLDAASAVVRSKKSQLERV